MHARSEPTGEIVTPERPNLVLTTNIPNVELDILVCYRFHIKTDCRNRCNILIKLELVEYC